MLDYKKDTKIDETALDVEWLAQTELGRRYAKHAAYMRKLANKAEQRIKVVKSELIHRCNKLPKKCTGKSKPNAQDIEAYYRRHSKHKRAVEEWIQAVYEASYAEMAYGEISFTKKKSLENLVSLYVSQYFAGPNVPRNLVREWERRQRSQSSNDAIVIRRKGQSKRKKE